MNLLQLCRQLPPKLLLGGSGLRVNNKAGGPGGVLAAVSSSSDAWMGENRLPNLAVVQILPVSLLSSQGPVNECPTALFWGP